MKASKSSQDSVYSSFSRDRERLLALVSRDVRIAVIAIATPAIVALGDTDWGEVLIALAQVLK